MVCATPLTPSRGSGLLTAQPNKHGGHSAGQGKTPPLEGEAHRIRFQTHHRMQNYD